MPVSSRQAELVTSYVSRLPLAELDLRGCKQVSDVSIRAVAANCSGTLRKIKLGGCNLLSDEALKSLVVCVRQLHIVSMSPFLQAWY